MSYTHNTVKAKHQKNKKAEYTLRNIIKQNIKTKENPQFYNAINLFHYFTLQYGSHCKSNTQAKNVQLLN